MMRKNATLKDPYARKHKVVLIQKVEANIKINKHLETFKRSQFSLTIAWTCTFHKVQRLTLHATFVCL